MPDSWSWVDDAPSGSYSGPEVGVWEVSLEFLEAPFPDSFHFLVADPYSSNRESARLDDIDRTYPFTHIGKTGERGAGRRDLKSDPVGGPRSAHTASVRRTCCRHRQTEARRADEQCPYGIITLALTRTCLLFGKIEYVAAIKSVADIAFSYRAGLVFLGPGNATRFHCLE